MKKYVITVRKRAVEAPVIAESFEKAIEEAKNQVSWYDFSDPGAYEFIEGREATEKDIEEYIFDDED